jgi:hypothetical protein
MSGTVVTMLFSHLRAMLQIREWAPPANQLNMTPLNPYMLQDLFDLELIDRDEKGFIVVTARGENALQAALGAFEDFV